MTNPDGRKQAETRLSWRKTPTRIIAVQRATVAARDLNRNFEFQWNCCGGSSGSECALTIATDGRV